jgi:hypothetical protein
MQSIVRRILIVGVTFGWSITCAHAGPCSNEIAKIDDVMRDPGPNIGPNQSAINRRSAPSTAEPFFRRTQPC